MRKRRYQVLDVFTDTVLQGNPLAVVHDCERLDTARMQAIAAEFNLSETVFVLAPRNMAHRAAIRIFTPSFEMPFAGHPTVGSAVALARETGTGTQIIVIEEKIGDVRCVATIGGEGADYAEFDLPQLSTPMQLGAAPEAIAAAVGLDPADVGFENHVVSCWSAGVPYVCIPVKGFPEAAKARINPVLWGEIAPDRGNGVAASAYVYCRSGSNSAFHARMFSGGPRGYEDPATGSALAAFSGAVSAFDRPQDGAWSGWIEQGVEMGRPSRLRLEMDVSGGEIRAARIGGHAVIAAEGTLLA